MNARGLQIAYSHILPANELVVTILHCEIYLQLYYSVNLYQNYFSLYLGSLVLARTV
jgi:hypothetical protein